MAKLNKEEIFNSLTAHKNDLEKYGVKRMGLFGSYVRHEETGDSDIDFIVEFKTGEKSFDNFMNLSFYLEQTFNKKIELVTPKALSPYIKPYIMKEVEYFDI